MQTATNLRESLSGVYMLLSTTAFPLIEVGLLRWFESLMYTHTAILRRQKHWHLTVAAAMSQPAVQHDKCSTDRRTLPSLQRDEAG